MTLYMEKKGEEEKEENEEKDGSVLVPFHRVQTKERVAPLELFCYPLKMLRLRLVVTNEENA